MKILTTLFFAGAAILAGGQAYAHSDAPHPKKQTAPVDAEQKDFGIAGDPKNVSRAVQLGMIDGMRFAPSALKVRRGETIRFIVKNNGKLMHEMVIGTMKDLTEHAALMKQHPGMEHDEPHMAHVAPGKTEEIVWQFNRPGEFHFACLVAGHFEAGMVGKISVE